jgi:hypothetical protein
MTRALACLAVATVLAACQTSHASNPATPQSVTLQPGDVPGMQRCDTSGDVTAVLKQEKAQQSLGYDLHATEWEQWKQQGAVDAYFAVYGRTAADCAAASGTTTGAPTGGLMVGLVVQFKDTKGAARNFGRDSTLMGLGPKDIRFIELAGGTTTFGSATGLGADSVVGSAVVAGSDYFVAEWQNGRFESDFMGYDTGFTAPANAVIAMNKRIVPAA